MLKGVNRPLRSDESKCTWTEIQLAKIFLKYRKSNRKVAQLDENKKQLREYECIITACISTNIRIAMIIRSIKTRKINCGYYWEYRY